MSEKWKPINFCGSWHHDPRDELRHRARLAERQNDSYVAIPVKLALAVASLRECSATTVLTGDEDGPLDPPIQIKCRLPEGHAPTIRMHYNGYTNWNDS